MNKLLVGGLVIGGGLIALSMAQSAGASGDVGASGGGTGPIPISDPAPNLDLSGIWGNSNAPATQTNSSPSAPIGTSTVPSVGGSKKAVAANSVSFVGGAASVTPSGSIVPGGSQNVSLLPGSYPVASPNTSTANGPVFTPAPTITKKAAAVNPIKTAFPVFSRLFA